MAFLILSAACLAMVAANTYQQPAADNTYQAPAPTYQSSGNVAYPVYSEESYEDSDSHEHKKRFHKLKDLNQEHVYDAEIRYFKHRGEHYAEISCQKKNDPKQYTWIVANADSAIPSGNPIPNTVALAGGVNVVFVAKYGHKKWTGRDYFNNDKQKFRRVGCVAATYETIVDIPDFVSGA